MCWPGDDQSGSWRGRDCRHRRGPAGCPLRTALRQPGDAKNTYGTGCFLLQHMGEKFTLSKERMITTLACSTDRKLQYALEGSIFIGGAVVQWLRDKMEFFEKAPDIEKLAASVKSSNQVVLVPAFTGLGAPHWDPYASGMIIGLQRSTGPGEIARAAIESIAFQVTDVLRAMEQDTEYGLRKLRADGGAADNNMLMQFQADMLGIPVERPAILETTAQGVAYLAGLATGFWADTDEIASTRPEGQTFQPQMDREQAKKQYARCRTLLTVPRAGTRRSHEARRDDCAAKRTYDTMGHGRHCGGATGAGVAVDAATRGYDVLLVEREDFGKGTSSRSTKLVHGGVRYLEQGNVSLVMEALKERGLLRQNAPHLVHDLAFVVPNYSWWEAPFYGIGMKIYDLLAGKYGFGKSRILSLEETLEALPTIQREGLRGGVVYHDGQFDDTRLLTHLIATAADHGATVINYASAMELLKGEDGFINGLTVEDRESGERYKVDSRVVINATGIFTDEVRRLAEPQAETMISPSQGIHLVFEKSFLRGGTAIMVPHTSDGRVLFAIPWHEHTLVGTTDTPIEASSYEPRALEEEIEFVLGTAGQYLSRPPTREDILSMYVGIRPLVKASGANSGKTSALSRDHTIHIDESGLLSIVGGK